MVEGANEMKKILIILLTFILLSGCKLATKTEDTADKFVGVLVTSELLFHDDFFNKEPSRLYATYDESTNTYDFENTENIYIILIRDVISGGENLNIISSQIYQIEQSITLSSDLHSIKGSLYSTTKNTYMEYFFNPVYKTFDGEIYAISGLSYSISPIGTYSNYIGSRSLEESYTETIDGVTSTNILSFEIDMFSITPPIGIRVTEMNSSNIKIVDNDYTLEALPSTINTNPDTEYIIVEEFYENIQETYREVYNLNSSTINTYKCHENSICEVIATPINW